MAARSDASAQAVREVPDMDQIAERLTWTPAERLRYLLDMLDFEEQAHRARRVTDRSR